MLQDLRRERFGLAVHRETRMLPVYELATGKGGPILVTPKPEAKKGLSYEGSSWARIHSETTSIADLAGLLSERRGRTVIDTTGIKTPFAVDLEYRFDDNDIAHPTIFNPAGEVGASAGGVEGTRRNPGDRSH